MAAGHAPDNGDSGLFNPQLFREEIGQFLVGFTLVRRRGDSYLENVFSETGYFVAAGVRRYFYRQTDIPVVPAGVHAVISCTQLITCR